jgi:hypothetical protein
MKFFRFWAFALILIRFRQLALGAPMALDAPRNAASRQSLRPI